jgi:hypothetical protein
MPVDVARLQKHTWFTHHPTTMVRRFLDFLKTFFYKPSPPNSVYRQLFWRLRGNKDDQGSFLSDQARGVSLHGGIALHDGPPSRTRQQRHLWQGQGVGGMGSVMPGMMSSNGGQAMMMSSEGGKAMFSEGGKAMMIMSSEGDTAMMTMSNGGQQHLFGGVGTAGKGLVSDGQAMAMHGETTTAGAMASDD